MKGWSLIYGGAEKPFADWGLTVGELTKRNRAASSLTLLHDGADFDSEPIFAFNSLVKVRFDGSPFFAGKVMQRGAARTSAGAESVRYVVQDAWRDLEDTKYGQTWKTWGNAAESEVTLSRVIVPSRVEGNFFTFIDTGEQIKDTVDFAISKGVNLQRGTVTPTFEIPLFEVTSRSCAEIIRRMLEARNVDAVAYIDQKTDPPTFHCILQEQRTVKNISLSEGRLDDIQLNRRDDMVVPAVGIFYERTNVSDGVSRRETIRDIWPVNSDPFQPRAICETVNLEGSVRNNVAAPIESEPVGDPATKAWWGDRGHLSIEEPNRQVDIIGYSVNGVPNGEFPYPYRLVNGQFAEWMPGNVADVKVTARVRTRIYYDAKKTELLKSDDDYISVQITVTDLVSKLYTTLDSLTLAEPVPSNLARTIFEGLSAVPHDGTLGLSENECQGDIEVFHKINILGGTGRYTNINAPVQEVRMNLDAGTTSITLGLPSHLDVNDLIAVTRIFRTRQVITNPAARVSSRSVAGGSVTFGNHQPVQNSASGTGATSYTLIKHEEGNTIEIAPAGRPKADEATGIDVNSDIGNGGIRLTNGVINGKAAQFIEMLWDHLAGKSARFEDTEMCDKYVENGVTKYRLVTRKVLRTFE